MLVYVCISVGRSLDVQIFGVYTVNSCETGQQDPDSKMRHLIRVSTVCKWLCHFSLGISKSDNLTYLKLKFDSSNVYVGGVYSV